MSDPTDRLQTFGDVVRWVVQELGALCPSQQRLLSWHHHPEDPSLQDVRYHVLEARCPICQAELQREASPEPPT